MCFFEHKSRDGVESRCWRFVAQVIGSLAYGALKIIQQISNGLPKVTLKQVHTCKGCTLGKYTNASFHYRDSRVEEILE